MLALEGLRYQLREEQADRPLRKALVGLVPPRIIMGFTEDYSKSFSKSEGSGKYDRPSVQDHRQEHQGVVRDINETSITNLAGAFEAFVQCWALNWLATILECEGRTLNKEERSLVDKFNPLLNKGYLPNIHTIFSLISGVKESLSLMPHTNRDPITKTPLDKPIDRDINAYRSILFWREYRNCSIHSSGIVTTKLFEKYRHFFDVTMESFRISLKPMTRLPYHEGTYGAMAASHYRIAKYLNDILEERSRGRRGHPESPASKTTENWPVPIRSRPLFQAGDHELSLAWSIGTDAWRMAEAKTRKWQM